MGDAVFFFLQARSQPLVRAESIVRSPLRPKFLGARRANDGRPRAACESILRQTLLRTLFRIRVVFCLFPSEDTFDNAADQVGEIDAGFGRRHWKERGFRKTRNGIQLQDVRNPGLFFDDKIDS